MICRCCGSNNLKQMIDLGMQPVAHNLLDHREDTDKVVNRLLLHYCEDCGFIQINEPIPPEKLYLGYNYCFSAWKKEPHIQDEIAVLQQYVPNKQIKILEIGCNDGVFIGPLLKEGYTNYVGIEPNSYAADEAKKYNVPIVNEMFNKETASIIKREHGTFRLIVMRQVLEHIVDLDELFEGIKQLMAEDARFLVEVPNFTKALDSGDCSTIWEEHPNYFTQNVLLKLLRKYGFVAETIREYDFSGGAICVLARHVGADRKIILNDKQDFISNYQIFSGKVHDYEKKLKTVLGKAKEKNINVLLYGTGSRACTLVNGLGLGEFIDCAIDDQKEKQEKYMPGCRLRILGMEDAIGTGKDIVLLAVNHENEDTVRKRIQEKKADACVISLFSPNDIIEEVDRLERGIMAL